MTTLTIPARVVPRVRDGAYLQLAEAAEAIERPAAAHKQPPDRRDQLNRAWQLLETVGWRENDHAGESVDVSLAHLRAAREAVEDILPMLPDWIEEMDPADPRKPGRVDELVAVRRFHARLREMT